MKNNQLPKKTFCFGTQYYRMVPLQEDWERDIANIKALGMDTIRFWALWKWAEPCPGKFYFEDLHALIQLAQKHDLDVILVIEMDKVPHWVRDSVPDHGLTNLNGTPDINEWAYVNWDHPEIRKLGERFLLEVTRQFKQYDRVIYDLWNEPDKPEDSGEISRAKFLKWLKEKFSSLEEMIEKLHLPRYESWDDIKMPKSTWDTSLYLLYEEFRTWSIAEQVRWAYNIVKAEVPDRPVTVHVHCDEHPFTFRWFKNQSEVGWDEWEMNKQVDFLITAVHEFYQGEGAYSKLTNIGAAVANLETKRSITKGQYWTTGLAGGASKGAWGKLSFLHERENLFSLWMCVAHEAKGAVYWQYRVERLLGPESPGWGLTAFDGTDTFRVEECREFINALRPYEKQIMAASAPKAKTAVLYSLKSHIINETQPHLDYISAFEGACFLFWFNQIEFDVICEKDTIEAYTTIYIPMGQCLEDHTIQQLIQFVDQGGKLIFEAGTGSFNEYGILNTMIPGGKAFVEASGIQEKDVVFGERFAFETPYGEITGIRERRVFSRSKNTVVEGTYPNGEAAVVRKKYGKGEFLYLSTNISTAIRKLDQAGQTKSLVRLIGLSPEIEVEGSIPVTVRVMENEESRFLFIFNHSREQGKATVNLPEPVSGSEVIHQGRCDFSIRERAISLQMEPLGGSSSAENQERGLEP